jgi:hypothetical protein
MNEIQNIRFDLPRGNLTPEVKNDFKVLMMRNYVDPKRNYKKWEGGIPEHFQVVSEIVLFVS